MRSAMTRLEYRDGETFCRGFYVRPENAAGPLPLVLVCPAWDGLVDEVRTKAEKLAADGYIAFAVDVLGDGKTLHNLADLEPALAPFMTDRAMLLRRLLAAVDAAQTIPGADLQRLAVIGYCFGGLCALDLARSADPRVKAAVSFHGGLAGNDLATDPVSAHVLVLHGNDDPLVPAEQVSAFQQEMTERQADWQLLSYGHTMHAFTRPGTNLPDAGAVYNPVADRRSWQAMLGLFEEVL